MLSMFMELLFVPAYSYWSARQRFEYRYKGLVLVTVIMSLSSPNEYDNIKKNSSYVVMIAAVLTSLAMLFGPELAIFAPAEYQAAVWIIPPVSMSVEFYFEKTKYVMCVSVLRAALNVFLKWIFITKYGYIAAGYTTVFCYLLFSADHYLLYKYLSKKYLAGILIIDFKLIAAVTVALMIVMGAVLVLYKITIARYGVILAIGLLAVVKRNKITDTLKTVLSKKK